MSDMILSQVLEVLLPILATFLTALLGLVLLRMKRSLNLKNVEDLESLGMRVRDVVDESVEEAEVTREPGPQKKVRAEQSATDKVKSIAKAAGGKLGKSILNRFLPAIPGLIERAVKSKFGK